MNELLNLIIEKNVVITMKKHNADNSILVSIRKRNAVIEISYGLLSNANWNDLIDIVNEYCRRYEDVNNKHGWTSI